MSKYQEWLKAKELAGEKYCPVCETYKHTSDFTFRVSQKDGLCSCCKVCGVKRSLTWQKENSDKIREQRRKYRAENPDKVRDINRRSKYKGYTEEHGKIMSCEICQIDLVRGNGNNKQCIDHNHETGIIRGVLCSGCNKALGLLKDNPEILREAARYLEERTS